MRRWCRLALLLAILLPGAAAADWVVPSDRVVSRVVVRERASRRSPDLGSLRAGERARLVATVPGWHRVRLADGPSGYVSTAWTRVVTEEPESALETRRVDPTPSALHAMRSAVVGLFRPPAEVEIRIQSPALGRVHGHLDPLLPVAGLAGLRGSRGEYDVLLVLDASTSTNEYAQADVDGDGVDEDEWKGDDSIFQGELTAARAFVTALRELPGNQAGRRIRVGLITLGGDEAFHRRSEERDLAPTPERILALAERDARVRLALTSDYDRVERALDRLAGIEPAGMTDLAAGIGRAFVELTAAEGARSQARPGAQKVIQLLTDGKAQLPYDRLQAEKAALRAARMAGEAGITLHAFSLGRNAVTGAANPSLRQMARGTGGRFVELRTPGEIVALLDTTAFSFVDRVRLENQTTGQDTDYIATGIDGSFYGEIPLADGANEIRVVAVLGDGRRASETLLVEYQRIVPQQELVLELDRLRVENEALIARIKQRLTEEIQEVRSRRGEERRQKILELEAAGQRPLPASLP